MNCEMLVKTACVPIRDTPYQYIEVKKGKLTFKIRTRKSIKWKKKNHRDHTVENGHKLTGEAVISCHKLTEVHHEHRTDRADCYPNRGGEQDAERYTVLSGKDVEKKSEICSIPENNKSAKRSDCGMQVIKLNNHHYKTEDSERENHDANTCTSTSDGKNHKEGQQTPQTDRNIFSAIYNSFKEEKEKCFTAAEDTCPSNKDIDAPCIQRYDVKTAALVIEELAFESPDCIGHSAEEQTKDMDITYRIDLQDCVGQTKRGVNQPRLMDQTEDNEHSKGADESLMKQPNGLNQLKCLNFTKMLKQQNSTCSEQSKKIELFKRKEQAACMEQSDIDNQSKNIKQRGAVGQTHHTKETEAEGRDTSVTNLHQNDEPVVFKANPGKSGCPKTKPYFRCAVCKAKFTDSKDIVEHVKLHEEQQKQVGLECEICGKCFQKQKLLADHVNVHTGDKPFSCTQCQRAFAWEKSLMRHLKSGCVNMEEDEQTETNDGQDKSSDSNSVQIERSKGHMNGHRKSRSKKYNNGPKRPRAKCHICGKEMLADSMKNHLLYHSGSRPYKCHKCGMGFQITGNLKRHLLVHDRKENGKSNPELYDFKCDQCLKSFYDKTHLDRHMVVHTGEKKYECDVCGKKYPYRSGLKRHKLTHTGEKRIECGVCKKKFFDSSSLIIHLRSHTGERPFECDHCGMRFLSRSNLSLHLKSHGGFTVVKKYSCKHPSCGKVFEYKSGLKTHLSCCHGNRGKISRNDIDIDLYLETGKLNKD